MKPTADYLLSLYGLENKAAIVSGGAGTLGREITKALLSAGAKVMIWSRTPRSLNAALDQLLESGVSPENLKGADLDVGSEAEVKEAVAHAEELLGTPGVLVNAAGGNMGKCAFVDIDIVKFEEVIRTNLLAGLVVPTKLIAARWIELGVKGSIINLASMTSFVPLSGVWAYNAAKAGVLNLTRAAAKEFAPYGIRVNAIAPGFFLGRQNRDLLIDRESGELTPRGKEVTERTPFGRFGKAGELAGTVLYLSSSNASGFVTGVTLPVDGGFLVDNI